MESSMAYWAELKLNGQILFGMPMLKINIHNVISVDCMRPEWEFGPDYALN